jgi:hypothetical protein
MSSHRITATTKDGRQVSRIFTQDWSLLKAMHICEIGNLSYIIEEIK